MTDKERKMALKRLRAENQELRNALATFAKSAKWSRDCKQRVVIAWAMSEECFETLQRIADVTIKCEEAGNGKV